MEVFTGVMYMRDYEFEALVEHHKKGNSGGVGTYFWNALEKAQIAQQNFRVVTVELRLGTHRPE